MRTKTLLIAAAALVAGVISSNAQVYSANVVGYINNPAATGFSVQTAPFISSPDNSLTNLVQNVGGALDGCTVYIWKSIKYNVVTLDSALGGVADATDSYATNCPILPAGTPFLIDNLSGSVFTNTYSGQVNVQSGSIPGTSTNPLPVLALNLVAPIIPVGGGVSSVLGLTNPGGALDGSVVYTPIINGSGQLVGFNGSTFDSGFSTGFGDSTDTVQTNEPIIPVGKAFFFNNQSGGTVQWVQTLTP